MVGIHVKFKIKEGDENILKFLDWKNREGKLQIKAQGFVKRYMTRDAEDPTVFFYSSFWQTPEQQHAFAQTEEFKRNMAESDVTNAVEWREFSNVSEVFEDLGENW